MWAPIMGIRGGKKSIIRGIVDGMTNFVKECDVPRWHLFIGTIWVFAYGNHSDIRTIDFNIPTNRVVYAVVIIYI